MHGGSNSLSIRRGTNTGPIQIQYPLCYDAGGCGINACLNSHSALVHDAGELWAVCAVHQVRWYVTRELSLVDRSERLGHPDPGAASKLPEVEVSFASSANGGRYNSFTQEPRPSWAISPTRARHDRPLSVDKKGLALAAQISANGLPMERPATMVTSVRVPTSNG